MAISVIYSCAWCKEPLEKADSYEIVILTEEKIGPHTTHKQTWQYHGECFELRKRTVLKEPYL